MINYKRKSPKYKAVESIKPQKILTFISYLGKIIHFFFMRFIIGLIHIVVCPLYYCIQNHSMVRLEEIFKTHLVQPPAISREIFN